MKIIEKKCPNCGAGLEFDENAKSCKCEYCKRSFEIERENNTFSGGYNYSLTKKTFNIFFLISFIAVFAFIGIVATTIFINVGKGFKNSNSNKMYSDVSELPSMSISAMDSKAPWTINNADVDLDEYGLEMQVKRKVIYLAYNKKTNKNMIISVYKAVYKKPFDKWTTGIAENLYTSGTDYPVLPVVGMTKLRDGESTTSSANGGYNTGDPVLSRKNRK